MVYNSDLFCKKCAQQIVVPEVVQEDLLSIIEEKLKKAGFYYRVAYRVKSVDSIVDKLKRKEYRKKASDNEEKKMQDLIGIRIILYFEDDVSICRSLLDTLFIKPGVWETTEANEYEFRAMKVNGIFQLPGYLAKTIANPLLKDYIDDTFEVQVRTNSFEGWHEIEHDLRYKGSAFGDGNEHLARKMNSILATLELCDDSLVNLIEDLGHQHYKDHNWSDMIRCHYRLKLNNEEIYPEIKSIFDSNINLAKAFYKFSRAKAITKLWDNTSDRTPNFSVNYIIYIVNNMEICDEKIAEVFSNMEGKQDNEDSGCKRKKFEPFKKLGTYTVFKAETYLDTSNITEIDAFKKASGYIYAWIKSRYNEALDGLPEYVSNYSGSEPGYSVEIVYDEKDMYFAQESTHIDAKIANRIWISKAFLKKTSDGIQFVVSNVYAEPKEKYRDTDNVLFSRPNFYGEIADNIGICDCERLKENVKCITDDNYDEFVNLIHNVNRHFPIILFIGNKEKWLDKFDIGYFSYLVGYYAHIRIIEDAACQERFAVQYHLDMSRYQDSITVLYAGKEPQTSYSSDITDTTFEVIKLEQKKYWNENGCRAYRRRLVADIRENNIK